MGAVNIDVYKKEKEYRHLTLSDEKVVQYLIENRSQLDVSYGANTNIDISVAGEIMEFNVELIALYASLDNILKRAKLREKDVVFLGLVFTGHTIRDVINLKNSNFPRMTAYRTMERIVAKVVATNKEDWKKCMQANRCVMDKKDLEEKGKQNDSIT